MSNQVNVKKPTIGALSLNGGIFRKNGETVTLQDFILDLNSMGYEFNGKIMQTQIDGEPIVIVPIPESNEDENKGNVTANSPEGDQQQCQASENQQNE